MNQNPKPGKMRSKWEENTAAQLEKMKQKMHWLQLLYHERKDEHTYLKMRSKWGKNTAAQLEQLKEKIQTLQLLYHELKEEHTWLTQKYMKYR